MPSTYSTNLKLELMATGENTNTWGVHNNNNLGTLIEQAIVATGDVVQDDAETTITITDGVSSAARCFVLNVTGSLGGQQNLVVPTIQKPYVVHNATTGGFGIQVKTAAGTGIVVANGTRRFLYVDGVNVIDMIDAFPALTLAGLTVSSASITINGFTVTPGGNWSSSAAVDFTGAVSTGGALTTANSFTTAGNFALTLTTTNTTNVTLPTTGTLASTANVTTQIAAQVIRHQVFTAGGTYTPHASMFYCIIECVGGGGAGGGAAGDLNNMSGGGGGGGGYARIALARSSVIPSQTVTIGAGGTAGTAGDNPGNNGGATSVGTLCVANGGTGGSGMGAFPDTAPGGAGGVVAGATGDVLIPGGPGSAGAYFTSGNTVLISGAGGAAHYGAGGISVTRATSGNTAGNAGQNYGGGGSGAASFNNAANSSGGAGGGGLVIITEFCTA